MLLRTPHKSTPETPSDAISMDQALPATGELPVVLARGTTWGQSLGTTRQNDTKPREPIDGLAIRCGHTVGI